MSCAIIMKKHSLYKEIIRKLFHLMELPVLLAYTLLRQYFSQRVGILGLTLLFLILLEVEYVRLEYMPKLPNFIALRKREMNNVTGTIFFIAATIIAFSAFDYPIAMTAMLLTIFGDLASALIGIKFGRHKIHKNKTLEGFLGGLAVNCVIGYLFLPLYPVIFLSMAFVASIVELFTGKLDDNLTIPLFAAFTGQMIAYFLAIPLAVFPGPIMESFLKFFHF